MSKEVFLYAEGNDEFYLACSSTSSNYSISSFLFDGEKGEPTYRRDFVGVKKLPIVVARETGVYTYVNPRWELKEGASIPFGELPKTLEYTEKKSSLDGDYYYNVDREWLIVIDNYLLKFDDKHYETVDVEFELKKADVRKGFSFVQTRWAVKYSIEDEITTHPGLLQDKPCKLSSEESYKIIRSHVKREIDHDHAVITSDYDFCFTVEKVIPLYEQVPYQVDINNGNLGQKRKRKPKIVTRYRVNRKAKIYEISPVDSRTGKPYGSYPKCPEFTGMNAEDLERNIQQYLSDLMADINKPLSDCPHCRGTGVV
jgi:hypothetical protein